MDKIDLDISAIFFCGGQKCGKFRRRKCYSKHRRRAYVALKLGTGHVKPRNSGMRIDVERTFCLLSRDHLLTLFGIKMEDNSAAVSIIDKLSKICRALYKLLRQRQCLEQFAEGFSWQMGLILTCSLYGKTKNSLAKSRSASLCIRNMGIV